METGLWIIKKVTGAISASQLKSFVRDELIKIIESLGDVNFESAVECLRNAKRSRTPSREVAMAITHLQSAYKIFNLAAEKESKRWLPNADREISCRKKAFLSLLFIVICYAYLKEKSLIKTYSQQLSESWLDYLHEARRHYFYTGNAYDNHKRAVELNQMDKNLIEFCKKIGGTSWHHRPEDIGIPSHPSTNMA
jgi:hypothetical protein